MFSVDLRGVLIKGVKGGVPSVCINIYEFRVCVRRVPRKKGILYA